VIHVVGVQINQLHLCLPVPSLSLVLSSSISPEGGREGGREREREER